MKQFVTATAIAVIGLILLTSSNSKAQQTMFASIAPSTVVPGVKLNAQFTDNNIINVSWASSQVAVNADIELERSFDQSGFKTICFIMAPESTEFAVPVCNFKDRNAVAAKGNVFYRLKQTDKEGNVTYSDIVAVKAKAQINP